MTSPRKKASNRANARSSSGPKTAKGRARSARNALRYGLSLPVLSDPTLSEEVADLARQIAGADATPKIQELACRIAEAQVDLRRVRGLRHDLISRALRDPDYNSRTNWDKKLMTALRIIRRCSGGEDVPEGEVKLLVAKLEEPDRFATIITEIAQRLPALDRYERRALSRRKLAIRTFDAAKDYIELARPYAGGKTRRSDMVSHVKILLETLADEEEHYKKILKRKLLKTPKYPDEDDDDPERVKRRS